MRAKAGLAEFPVRTIIWALRYQIPWSVTGASRKSFRRKEVKTMKVGVLRSPRSTDLRKNRPTTSCTPLERRCEEQSRSKEPPQHQRRSSKQVVSVCWWLILEALGAALANPRKSRWWDTTTVFSSQKKLPPWRASLWSFLVPPSGWDRSTSRMTCGFAHCWRIASKELEMIFSCCFEVPRSFCRSDFHIWTCLAQFPGIFCSGDLFFFLSKASEINLWDWAKRIGKCCEEHFE